MRSYPAFGDSANAEVRPFVPAYVNYDVALDRPDFRPADRPRGITLPRQISERHIKLGRKVVMRVRLMSIPNLITMGRILSVPLVIWFILSGQIAFAFALFVLAGISDGVDGYLAKRYEWQTELGAYLDAVADKVLLVSIYLSLGSVGLLPVWLVITVVARDFLIVGGVILAWLLENPLEIRPSFISKVNTAGQITLAALVLANSGFDLGLQVTIALFVLLAGILTIWSAATYVLTWLQHMAGVES